MPAVKFIERLDLKKISHFWTDTNRTYSQRVFSESSLTCLLTPRRTRFAYLVMLKIATFLIVLPAVVKKLGYIPRLFLEFLSFYPPEFSMAKAV